MYSMFQWGDMDRKRGGFTRVEMTPTLSFRFWLRFDSLTVISYVLRTPPAKNRVSKCLCVLPIVHVER